MKDMYGHDAYFLGHLPIMAETERAVLCDLLGLNLWIPKSQICERQKGIWVSRWWTTQNPFQVLAIDLAKHMRLIPNPNKEEP